MAKWLLGGLAVSLAASAAVAQPALSDGGPWRRMAETDVAFVRDTLQSHDIYAFLPDPAAWRRVYEPATTTAQAEAAKVDSFAGYRAVLKHYVGAFQDPHLSVRFNIEPAALQWPGLLAAYRAGKVIVGVSQTPGVAAGAAVESCDGVSVLDRLDALSAYEGGERGLESTRAAMARQLFVDARNPFVPPPSVCRIGGADVTLAWRPVTPEALAVAGAPLAQPRDRDVTLSDFGRDGAWVRLPVFAPDAAQARQFHEVIARAPQLRTKSVIVLDVRGNGGGPYNWWVALLHSLYGEDYARWAVRDRLLIDPVFVFDPAQARREAVAAQAGKAASPASPEDALKTPPDTDLDKVILGWDERPGPDGRTLRYLKMADRALRERPKTPAPPNPVKARVYVLTDYGCGSSCVAFLDDMLLIPGVKQIGLEIHPDRWSASPVSFPLPSGNGTLGVPSLIRLNRNRGDLVQLAPAYKFAGDINDTAAVRRWVRETVIARDRPRTGAH